MLQNNLRLVDIENAQIELVEDSVVTDDMQWHPLERLVVDELKIKLDSGDFVGRHCDGAGLDLHAQL